MIGLALMLNSTLMVNAMAVGEATPVPSPTLLSLTAPAINYPLNNATLNNYPREAYLEWTKVAGASDYDVEIACDVCSTNPEKWAQVNTYVAYDNYFVTQPLAGDNQFRFRVKAYGYNGQSGPWSDYIYFYYSTGSYLKVDGVDDNFNFTIDGKNTYYLDVLANDEYTKTMGISELKVKTPPLYGAATVENNKIKYVANGSFTGHDDLGYEVKFYDDSSKSYYMTSAWVDINRNDQSYNALKAAEDTFNFYRQTADDNSKFTMDVLANDSFFPATPALSVSVTPLYGKAYVDNYKIVYTPNKGFTGFDDLKYKITSTNGASSEAWVNINIKSNTPYTYKETVKCVFQGATKSENCYLAGGQDTANLTCSGKETCGIDISGSEYQKEYTWKSSCGGYAYTYLDGTNDYAYFTCGSTTSGTLTAKADNYNYTIADPYGVNSFLLDVLSNDAYGVVIQNLNVGVTANALHGTATVDSSKKIKYVPTSGYIGYDDFEYQISTSDGLYTSKAWVTINTTSPNYKALMANPDSVTATKDKENTFYVLKNDSYPGKVNLAVTVTPLYGKAYASGEKIVYVPNPGYTGYDDFEYSITDTKSNAASAFAWVYIDVKASTKTPPAGFEYPVNPSPGLENPFTDIDPNSTEGKAAIYLYHKAVIGGYEDGTFRPDNYVNRAEIAKFIANVLFKGNVKAYTAADSKGLTDIFVSDWFYNFVVAMLQHGIFDGYPDKSFKPGNYINAAELAKVLSNAFGLEVEDVSEYGGLPILGNYFKDVTGSEWFAPYAYYTVVENKLFPKREIYFNGGTNVTRGELAYAIYKIMTDTGL